MKKLMRSDSLSRGAPSLSIWWEVNIESSFAYGAGKDAFEAPFSGLRQIVSGWYCVNNRREGKAIVSLF